MVLKENKDKKEFKETFDEVVNSYRSYEMDKYKETEDSSWQIVSGSIDAIERLRLRKRRFYIASVAASVFLLLGITSLWMINKTDRQEVTGNELSDVIEFHDILPTDEILLITSEQKRVNIENNSNVEYDSDGTVVVNYQQINQPVPERSKERNYNQIIVPKGKRTTIFFADGSRIFVNSGTKVTYPAVFDENQREIHVDGEIYLEVAHNQSCPFIVKTTNFSVRVLGTSFGVSAYAEDRESFVALLTGKVEVETNHEKVTLLPDELFALKESDVSVRKVNAYEYVAWRDGMMILHKEPLSTVLARLSRYYGKEIQYPLSVNELNISGKLDLKDRLEDVMENITSFAPVIFTIHNDTIVIESAR